MLRLVLALLSLTLAQNYRGEAVPIPQRATPVEFSRLRFLTFVFGREGPMDAPLSTPPVIGREYFVEADVYGIESAANIRFELIDAAGRAMQTIPMWKGSDGSADGEFYGFVTTPGQPFRAAIAGTNSSGGAFRSVLSDLFQPVVNGPVDPPVPAAVQEMLNTYRLQLRARAARAAIENPGGTIAIPRPRISAISYETLTSATGSVIGLRLRYSIQFPSQQTIAAVPHVFPLFSDPALRGTVTMKPLTGSITPQPQMVGAQSLQDVIVYQAEATYRAGVPYTFNIDMIPDYVFQGTQTGRFCIHEQKFSNRSVWDALVTGQNAIPYTVTISDAGYAANIPAFLPQRTFRDSFAAAGAIDCGATPNIRF